MVAKLLNLFHFAATVNFFIPKMLCKFAQKVITGLHL
mgnify:FL=1